MIDCTKTENYLTVKLKLCEIGCNHCPLSFVNNDKKILCNNFETQYHQKAIELIQQWSDEHPQKTFLTEFLKHYPNALLRDNGTPKSVCLYELGLMNLDNCEKSNGCIDCWNQPIKDGEK